MINTGVNLRTYLFPEKKIKEIESRALAIMKNEMGLKMRSSTLIWNNYLYRIRFLLFEDEQKWGYFDAEHFEIGIHINAQDPDDILRHELAHLIAFLRTGDLSHGKIFRAICKEFGFSPKIQRAAAPNAHTSPSRIAEKIKKILALASSNNTHEAQNATLKAQELLLKHQIEDLDEEASMVMRRLFHFKRSSAKLHAISEILRTFGVQPIFNSKSLEIFGSRTCVDIAEYVAHFLNHELEHLYKAQTHLRGLAAKNSFFRGIAEGYCDKIATLQSKHERALYKIDYALQKALPLAYPNLRTKRSRVTDHKEGRRAGNKTGKSLNIRQPLPSTSKSIHFLNN